MEEILNKKIAPKGEFAIDFDFDVAKIKEDYKFKPTKRKCLVSVDHVVPKNPNKG